MARATKRLEKEQEDRIARLADEVNATNDPDADNERVLAYLDQEQRTGREP
jgi:hypothetical protein